MLFGARRYAEARTAFQDLQKLASGDDRELVDLRGRGMRLLSAALRRRA